MVSFLTPLGFQTRQASNGEDALSIWSTWQPQLIFMDIEMPLMDGIAATKEIRDLEKNRELSTKIIGLSANVFEANTTEAFAAGFDEYITKPLEQDIVLEKISNLLNLVYLAETDPPGIDSELSTNDADSTRRKLKHYLANMPEDWIKRLHKTAYICDQELIIELLKEIPPQYAELAEAIADLINQFEFETIIELTSLTNNK